MCCAPNKTSVREAAVRARGWDRPRRHLVCAALTAARAGAGTARGPPARSTGDGQATSPTPTPATSTTRVADEEEDDDIDEVELGRIAARSRERALQELSKASPNRSTTSRSEPDLATVVAADASASTGSERAAPPVIVETPAVLPAAPPADGPPEAAALAASLPAPAAPTPQAAGGLHGSDANAVSAVPHQSPVTAPTETDDGGSNGGSNDVVSEGSETARPAGSDHGATVAHKTKKKAAAAAGSAPSKGTKKKAKESKHVDDPNPASGTAAAAVAGLHPEESVEGANAGNHAADDIGASDTPSVPEDSVSSSEATTNGTVIDTPPGPAADKAADAPAEEVEDD